MPPRYIAVPFTAGGGQLPIPTPSITATTVSGTQINLSLIYAGPPGASSFSFERSTSGSGPFVPIASGTSSTFSDTGLTFQTTYFYRGRVQVNDGRFSSYSTIVSATTLASVPGQPQNLQATAVSTSEIDLTWNSVSQASSYNVYRGGVQIGTNVLTPSFQNTGLTSQTLYTYTVTAVNATGESPQSAQASATTFPAQNQGSVKWNPGWYGKSFTILQAGRTFNQSQFTADYSKINAAPSQIVGYESIITWSQCEPVEANPGNFDPNGDPSNDGNYHWAEIDGTLSSIGTRKWGAQLNFGKFNTGTQSLPSSSATDEAVPGYIKSSSALYGAAVPSSFNTGGISGCYVQQTGGYAANITNSNVLIKIKQFLSALARRYDSNPQVAIFILCEDANMVPQTGAPTQRSLFTASYQAIYQWMRQVFPTTPVGVQATFQVVPQQSETVIEDMQARGVLWGTADTNGYIDATTSPASAAAPTLRSWGGNMMIGTYNDPSNPVSGVTDRRSFMGAAVDRQGATFDRTKSTDLADYTKARNLVDQASYVFFNMEDPGSGNPTLWYHWSSFVQQVQTPSCQLTNIQKPSFYT